MPGSVSDANDPTWGTADAEPATGQFVRSQPERACVFRARNRDEGIQVKLVDADGCAWRQKAIASIAEWLRDHHELGGVTILG